MEEAHDSSSGGHFGVNKTLEKIRKRQLANKMLKNDTVLAKSVSKKRPSAKGKSPMQIYNVGAPLERIQMDILDPLPTITTGNRFLLVVIDCVTNFPLEMFERGW